MTIHSTRSAAPTPAGDARRRRRTPFAAKTLLALTWLLALASSTSAQTTHAVIKQLEAPVRGATPRAGVIQGADGAFYGTTLQGGAYNLGTAFRVDGSGVRTVIHEFRGSDGATPFAGLVEAPDGSFYGTTLSGGASSAGTLYRLQPDDSFGWTLSTLVHFSGGTDGGGPYAGLIVGADGALYGSTTSGGLGFGTVFRFNGVLTTLHRFTGESGGWFPTAALLQASDGNFYGTTEVGGGAGLNSGIVFRLTPAGAFTTLFVFSGANGGRPEGALIEATDGFLYGTTAAGLTGNGTVFRMSTAGSLTTIHSFAGNPNAETPFAGLVQASDGYLYGTTSRGGGQGGGVGAGTVFRMDTAGTLTILHRFSAGVDGGGPLGTLTEGADGTLYGTTSFGTSPAQGGTVFRIDLAGSLTTVSRFASGPDGARPLGEMIRGTDGAYYGTTQAGGEYGRGTVFRVTSSGAWSTLYTFTGAADGGAPWAGVTQGIDGAYYGTTTEGGATGYGTVFRLTDSGSLTTLYSFTGGADGYYPVSTLLQGADAAFYGTTQVAGLGGGTIFRIDGSGAFSTLHQFSGVGGGGRPSGALVQGPDGTIYGTTAQGASGHGSVYALTTGGAFTTLYLFTGGSDGGAPFGGVIQGADGNLYGTTTLDALGFGTVFRITPAGALTTLYRFTGDPDGGQPIGRLLQGADGAFYGTTYYGSGFPEYGGAFRLDSAGQLTPLHMFTGGTGGSRPFSGLLEIDAHTFIGTTAEGGTSEAGTIFTLSLPLNQPPTADNASVSTAVNTPLAIVVSAADPEGQPLTYAIASAPVHGTLSGTAPTLTYTPTAGYAGPDAFSFTASDGAAVSNVATVSITVTPQPLSVQLLSPNGGERLFATVPYAIRWNATSASSFDLALSRDAGATFVAIAGCVNLPATATSCAWVPTTPAGVNALIRITARDAGGAAQTDVSNAVFAIANGTPTLRITAPNTMVNWGISTQRQITWTHNLGVASSVRLELSRDDGSSWSTIAASIANATATTGTFTWTVTGPAAVNARLRVTWLDGPAADVNDQPFVVSAPNIQVTAPNTNVSWTVDAARVIRWSHNLPAGELMRIDLSRDNGATWTAVATNVPNTSATQGTYSWTVAGPTTTLGLVRVSRVTDAAVQDVSDVTFRIASRITVTYPNAAVSLGAGTTRTVTFNHDYGAAQSFDLHFSADNGATWTRLVQGVPAASATTGTVTTQLPATTTTSALVRVEPTNAFGLGDVSNNPFTLAPASVTVTAPTSSVNWAIGSVRAINWSHNLGQSEFVNVEISRDGGATWTALASDVPNTNNGNGTYAWTVTGPTSTQARIRVTWAADGSVSDVGNQNFRIQ